MLAPPQRIRMKTLTRLDVAKNVFGNADISFVYSSDLKKLVIENDELATENTLLKIELAKMEERVKELTAIQECSTFVRLYA